LGQAVLDMRQANAKRLIDSHWCQVKDADPRARAIFDRHYSRRHYRDGRRPKKFVGPGEYIVLIRPQCDALFIWRKFRSMDNQKGLCCAVFRNESPVLSSELILDAERWARARWPAARLYTYVNPRKIESANPGYCFLCAGWQRCGWTKSGLIVMEKWQ